MTGPASRPAKPSGTSRAPRTATDSGRTVSRAAALHKAQVRQHAVGSCACSAPRPRRRTERPCGTPAPQKPDSLGLRAYSMTPGVRLVGCALSLSVFSLWQSLHSACRVCTLPQRPASPAPRGPARRCRPSARSRTARASVLRGRVFCLSAAPGTSRLPSAASGRSRAPSRPGAGPGTPAPAPRTIFAAPRAPPPAVLRRAADGHLGLSPAAMSWRRASRRSSAAPAARPRRQSASTLGWRHGLPRLAPVEHARRLPLQHPLHGPVHVAVPVEGQEAHGACSFSAGS